MTEPKHANRLKNETSPYLLQHAHNPVDWFPWGEEALQKARTEDKPIFLSIGYSACHWCHVMERESFENEAIAEIMNQLFINIKVDREERPDLDSIYMDAVQVMTQHGGWPMSVFLMPDGAPFYGGTYYPPEPRHGMPSFQQVLMSVADAYENRNEQVQGQAKKLTELLAGTAQIVPADQDLGVETLDQALDNLAEYFDEYDGGFGSEPKFPQPMTLDFAMSQYKRTGNAELLYMAELTLEKMAKGGLYDQLGGGFHRYSTDSVWLVPHFEKMLYDNAQLLRTYLHAWQITKKPFYACVINETIDYVLREMTLFNSGNNSDVAHVSGNNSDVAHVFGNNSDVTLGQTGGFFSTQDADTEGEEGKFFVWTPDEIESVLGDAEQARFVNAHYGVSARGNFEGKNILNLNMEIAEVAQRFGTDEATVDAAISAAKQKLFDARKGRVTPGRDEKILTEWNGLMIHAMAACGATLGRTDALEASQNAADFILKNMSQTDERLYRSYKDGQAKFNAYLEDYAAFIRGLIALYEATFELRWLAEASRLTQVMLEQFADSERPGFFQTGVDHEQLVVRRKDFIDNAIPSGNAMAAEALLRLSVLTGNESYRKRAAETLMMMKDAMARQPTGFGRMLTTLDALLSPSQEVAIVGDPADGATQKLLAEVRTRYLPNTVLALKAPNADNMLPLLAARDMVDGKAAAYVCENYVCKLPVTDADALAKLLG